MGPSAVDLQTGDTYLYLRERDYRALALLLDLCIYNSVLIASSLGSWVVL